jgi:hypothetical protein
MAAEDHTETEQNSSDDQSSTNSELEGLGETSGLCHQPDTDTSDEEQQG